MDLNELQSVRSRERQTAELQQLRESFYEEVGDYIDQRERERERAAERADDPFSDPEVQRLTDDIEAAKGTVESLYERRIGKVVKQASLEAAGMGAETEGLTREERDAFESIVATIETNRERVLDGVVAGEPVDTVTPAAGKSLPTDAAPTDAVEEGRPGQNPDPEAPPESELGGDRDGRSTTPADATDRSDSEPGAGDGASDTEPTTVDAAELMGDRSEPARDSHDPDAESDPDPAADPAGATPSTDGGTGLHEADGSAMDAGEGPGVASGGRASPGGGPDADADADPGSGGPTGDGDGETDARADAEQPALEHATVHVTADVGEILGIDERTYELARADIVRLPEPNAEALIERGAAERL